MARDPVSSTVGQLKLFDRHAVNLLAVSRRGAASATVLRGVKVRAGRLCRAEGNLAAMPETLGELHCLPLAERTCELDAKRASCRCGGAHPGQMAVAIGAACDFLTPSVINATPR